MIECLNGYSWVAHNRPKTSNKKCYFVLQIICQKKENTLTKQGVGWVTMPSQFPNL